MRRLWEEATHVPGEKPEPPRMPGASCFEQARQRTSSTFRMRGDDVNRMVKITRPVSGRSQAGNTQVASYSDPESRIQICETCYQREKVPVRWDTYAGFARLVGGPVPSDWVRKGVSVSE
ncbi:MAG: hypothetical protein V1862_09530 [Methanobacteriota archaeon]